MANVPYFVGRQTELKQFDAFLRDPAAQAALIVGQAGMGKTTLAQRMAQAAENHPDLKCAWVRYEVTPTDSPAGTMALMIDHAFEAAQVVEGSFSGTPRRRKQWEAFVKAVVPKGDKLVELVNSLRRDPQRDTRTQFIERLELISRLMPDNGRALFIVDPEKYMQEGSADDWRLVTQKLPDKVKHIFPQRPDDQLITSAEFRALPNVVRIPPDDLPPLSEQAVDDLVNHRASEVHVELGELRPAIARYEGHPYAIDGALDLLAAGRSLADLPTDPSPTGIAAQQWRKICDFSPEAIRLFKAYALLEVSVPFEVVEAVAEVDADTCLSLLAKPYLNGLLREEADSRRIYHALLADRIRAEIPDEKAKPYHQRAVDIYRRRLKADVKPDALAAVRLPEHVLALGDTEHFVLSFLVESSSALRTLGLLDDAISLTERALQHAKTDSEAEAMLSGNLGLIYRRRGDLDRAEELHHKALEICRKLGRLQGMASQYGNLGLIYQTRGDLDRAEEMLRKSLEINEKLGRLQGMANQYGNLGLIYQMRGDLDRAEELHRKALEIDDQLGRLAGVANHYGNLGLIYGRRGDLDRAEEMLRKSLAIEEKLGQLEGMANDYGNLGLIYQTRGDLDRAEEMHRKALEIDEKLGRLEGMASHYGNLGLVCEARGDLSGAREYWTKARDLFAKIGMQPEVDRAQRLLNELDAARGDA